MIFNAAFIDSFASEFAVVLQRGWYIKLSNGDYVLRHDERNLEMKSRNLDELTKWYAAFYETLNPVTPEEKPTESFRKGV